MPLRRKPVHRYGNRNRGHRLLVQAADDRCDSADIMYEQTDYQMPLALEAGAQPVRNTLIFFGSCAGEAHFDGYAENLIEVIIGARSTVTLAGLIDERAFDEAIATLKEWRHRSDAAIWYAMSWAEGKAL